MSNLKNIFPSVVILALVVGCESTDYQPTESEFIVNKSGFKTSVSALYPGCEYDVISVVGPGYYEDVRCYRVTSVIKLADGSRKKVQMLCQSGICWEEEVIKKDEE